MNYNEQIQALETEIKAIQLLPKTDFDVLYLEVDTKEEAITLIEDEINELKEKQDKIDEYLTNLLDEEKEERYYHPMDINY